MLYDLNIEKSEIKARIKDFPEDIARIKAELNTLALKKGLIGDIKIVQEPEVSLYPVRPKKKVIISLAGLFFFLFLAFFIEHTRSTSKEE